MLEVAPRLPLMLLFQRFTTTMDICTILATKKIFGDVSESDNDDDDDDVKMKLESLSGAPAGADDDSLDFSLRTATMTDGKVKVQ